MNFLIIFEYSIQYILLNFHLALLALGVCKRLGRHYIDISQWNHWTGILHLSLGLPTDFLELLSATWETKLLDMDGSWKEGTKYLEKESLEADFGEAGISLSLN